MHGMIEQLRNMNDVSQSYGSRAGVPKLLLLFNNGDPDPYFGTDNELRQSIDELHLSLPIGSEILIITSDRNVMNRPLLESITRNSSHIVCTSPVTRVSCMNHTIFIFCNDIGNC